MNKTSQARKQNLESKARIEASQSETRKVWASGICPQCGAGLCLNLSISGWVQCDQYGAIGFRKDSTKPACSYRGFMV